MWTRSLTRGLLRVGGRLHHSSLDRSEKSPLIIPGQHHIATLLIRHHHEEIHPSVQLAFG